MQALSVRQISRDALRHVGLDVVVVYIVISVATIRSKEHGKGLGYILRHGDNSGIRHNHAAGEVDLRVRTDIPDLRLASFLILIADSFLYLLYLLFPHKHLHYRKGKLKRSPQALASNHTVVHGHAFAC